MTLKKQIAIIVAGVATFVIVQVMGPPGPGAAAVLLCCIVGAGALYKITKHFQRKM